MRVISLFDTTINDYNLGNQIIMESVHSVINELFPNEFLFTLPCDGYMSNVARMNVRRSDYVLYGGTNALSSHMLKYNQIGFGIRDLIAFSNLTLLGVGWWQYQSDPDFYTRHFLRRLLSKTHIHSVRDEYTKRKLLNIGIDLTLNTSCPTTWKLTPEHCSKIPTMKARNVVTTLTDYNKLKDKDEQLLMRLADSYATIYCWIQGVGDAEYINSFTRFRGRIEIIPPKLHKFDQVLETVDCDYIGTRLHAGIRAIQKGKRSLILAVDNRAIEISKDINLNVCSRDDLGRISDFISAPYKTNLQVPFSEIAKWKGQFA